MVFEKKEYNAKGELQKSFYMNTVDAAKRIMQSRFYSDDTVCRYEEFILADGRLCLSLKDRSNVIVIQLKEQKPPF